MNTLVEKHLSRQLKDSSKVLELLSHRFGGKGGGTGKQATEDGDIESILNSTKVNESKGCKGCISLPIHFLASFDHLLYQKVREGRFDSRENDSKGQRMLDRDAGDAGI